MPAELLIRILTSELPLDGSLRDIASLLPRVNLALQSVSTSNTPVQALATEDADLDLRHVQPTRVLGRVVELHPAQELGRCAFTQYVVEALSEVDIQVVQNQMDSASLGIRVDQQVADEGHEVDLAPALCDRDDWSRSSAGRSGARICDHWVMKMSDWTDPQSKTRYLSLVPMWTFKQKLASVDPHRGDAYTHYGKLQTLDRRVKVPFAWYFYMLHGNRVLDGSAKRVLTDAEAGLIVVPEHDYQVLLDWRSSSFGF